jgi:queuine tRNA-ribosyltransferase
MRDGENASGRIIVDKCRRRPGDSGAGLFQARHETAMEFRVLCRDTRSAARTGEITTSRGTVRTPVFMPVATRGTVRALSLRDVEEIGFAMLLANTYHLYLRPGMDLLRKTGGLHRFMNYHRPILTDSGGFQAFSLSGLCTVRAHGMEFQSHLDGSRHFFTPEGVLDFQEVIGSDIMMVLDQCTRYPVTVEEARTAVERTVRWAGQSHRHWKDGFDTGAQGLFAIVQGSTYRPLREDCARRITDLEFTGFAIGGLSVGEPKGLYREITEITMELLPPDRPRYMMGVGSPVEILYAVRCGVDMFDCVMPTRIARNGTLYTSRGRINIRAARFEGDMNPVDEDCSCYVCRHFTRAYLRHLFRVAEISSLIYNTYHNLSFMKNFMEGVQKSIENGSFEDFSAKWALIDKSGGEG